METAARVLQTPHHLRGDAGSVHMLTPVREFVDGVNVIEVGIVGVAPRAFGDIGASPFIGALNWLLGMGDDSSSINGSKDAMFLRIPSLQFPDFVNHLAIEAKL